MLSIMLMAAMPAKNTINEIMLSQLMPLALNSRKPTIKLNNAQTTFTVGDDKPFPGGLAKGVGNLLPQIPITKCGTRFAKKAPAKKQARY